MGIVRVKSPIPPRNNFSSRIQENRKSANIKNGLRQIEDTSARGRGEERFVTFAVETVKRRRIQRKSGKATNWENRRTRQLKRSRTLTKMRSRTLTNNRSGTSTKKRSRILTKKRSGILTKKRSGTLTKKRSVTLTKKRSGTLTKKRSIKTNRSKDVRSIAKSGFPITAK